MNEEIWYGIILKINIFFHFKKHIKAETNKQTNNKTFYFLHKERHHMGCF